MPDRSGVVPTVGDLLERPELGLRLPPEAAARLLGKMEGATAVLRVAAGAPAQNGDQPPTAGLIPVEEAARMAGVTREQFLRRLAFRGAIVKAGHRTLRVSERKLRRILAELGA